MISVNYTSKFYRLVSLLWFIIALLSCSVFAIVFEEVSSLHIWLSVSSLAKKDPNNPKSLIFRQIELNWINAPLEDNSDYIALYLDGEPASSDSLPVSVHKLNGHHSGKIITDYYLPLIDFYNLTKQGNTNEELAHEELESVEMPNQKQHQVIDSELQQFNKWQHRRAPSVQTMTLPATGRNKLESLNSLQQECLGYCVAYHSGKHILASNCLKTKPTWMQDIFSTISSRSLPTLMIPGTHNSATYPRQLDKSVLQMINKYQVNQDDSIFNQLVYGVRYLDLRIGYCKVKQRTEQLWIYHDIFRTEVSANEVFEQVRKFLDATTHEIIIMDFHRFTVGFQNENAQTQRERHAKLIDLLFKYLGHYIIPSHLGQHAPIQEYVSLGKRLLVGYAGRTQLLGTQQQSDQQYSTYTLYQQAFDNKLAPSKNKPKVIHDIDAIKQDQDDQSTSLFQPISIEESRPGEYERIQDNESDNSSNNDSNNRQNDRHMATRIYNKLKSLKVISHSFSKRSIRNESEPRANHSKTPKRLLAKLIAPNRDHQDQIDPSQKFVLDHSNEISASIAKAALFFGPVRHLWPDKDTLDGLAQYMNETTCRKYFGELRSMMVELTPTVFGAISDKYDGNRKLAHLVNRPVTDWIRDRWSHCVNIVASDFFLGNDLINLAIRANRMRVHNRDTDELTSFSANKRNSKSMCTRFRKIDHLIDKSKIPIQFAYQPYPDQQSHVSLDELGVPIMGVNSGYKDDDVITHFSPNGNKILLRPLILSQTGLSTITNAGGHVQSRERRDSFVDNMSDGFADLFLTFKRLFNL